MADGIEAPITPWDMGLDGRGATGASGPRSPTENLRPRELCEQCGLDIQHVKEVSSASEIKGRDHTLYLVSGQLDGGRWFDSVRDVAIVGKPGEHARMRTETRDWDFAITDEANGFVLANLTFDQTARGAWARVNAPGRNVHIRNIETKGSGRRANPTPGKRLGGKSGPTYFIPTTSESATNHIVNVELTHNGVFPVRHFGDRPSGIWLGRTHRGTLRVVDSLFTGIPNNSLYCTAAPGRLEVEHCTFKDNGVACGGRFSHGYWYRSDISFNYKRDFLSHARQPKHGLTGLSIEQKKWGVTGADPPDVRDCTIRMKNVAAGGVGIRGYDIYRDARIGTIEDTEIHIEQGAGNYAADLDIPGTVEAVRDCELSGSNGEFVSVLNRGDPLVLHNTKYDYPNSRKRSKGNAVEWR